MGETVRQIMQGFAQRTGLASGGQTPERYLWTDAFAVCNFLGLYVEDGDENALRLALALVDQTHRILGRHRPDDLRSGWISGLDEQQGAQHPTVGGLRIGKPLPERRAGEPHDAALEWDRDGQYYHYLTRWMQALGSVSRVTKQARFDRWARELARTASARFTVRNQDGSPVGLCWKMSIDLSRPLVAAMGQHDALDGFVTYSRLCASGPSGHGLDLEAERRELSQMGIGRDCLTRDALGIGGLLTNAHALVRMMEADGLDEPDLLGAILGAALGGLSHLHETRWLEESVERRLPFRELGLSIGLRAIDRLRPAEGGEPPAAPLTETLRPWLDALAPYSPWSATIEAFWQQRVNQHSPSWLAHREINEVMLATSLSPSGFLEL